TLELHLFSTSCAPIRLILLLLTPPLALPTTPFPYTTLFRSRKQNQLFDFSVPRGIQGSKVPAQARADEHDRLPAGQSLDELELRSEEHTSELQSRFDIVCRLLLEKKTARATTAAAA